MTAYWYALTLNAMPHTTAGWVALDKQRAGQLKRKQDQREGAAK